MKIFSQNLAGWLAVMLAATFVSLSSAQCEQGVCDSGNVASECKTGPCRLRSGCLGKKCRGCRSCIAADPGDGMHCGRPAPQYPVPFATPRPTVPTHLTYPPMAPHNSLPHYRHTYSYRHNDGLSRTNVHWQPFYAVQGFQYLHHLFELPR